MSREKTKDVDNGRNDHHAATTFEDGSKTDSLLDSPVVLEDDQEISDVQSLSDADDSDSDVLDVLHTSKAAPQSQRANETTTRIDSDVRNKNHITTTNDTKNITTTTTANTTNNKQATRAKHRKFAINTTLLFLSILSFPVFLVCGIVAFCWLVFLLYKLWLSIQGVFHGVQQVLWLFQLVDWSSPTLQFFILWAMCAAWVWWRLRSWGPVLDRMLGNLY